MLVDDSVPLSTLAAVEIAKIARQESPSAEEIRISDLEEGAIIRVQIPNSDRVYLGKILKPESGKAYFVRWNANKPSKLELFRIGIISSPVLRLGGTLDFKNDDVDYSLPIEAMSILYV